MHEDPPELLPGCRGRLPPGAFPEQRRQHGPGEFGVFLPVREQLLQHSGGRDLPGVHRDPAYLRKASGLPGVVSDDPWVQLLEHVPLPVFPGAPGPYLVERLPGLGQYLPRCLSVGPAVPSAWPQRGCVRVCPVDLGDGVSPFDYPVELQKPCLFPGNSPDQQDVRPSRNSAIRGFARALRSRGLPWNPASSAAPWPTAL